MIDFDITEEGWQMGLSFLSVGKYFQFNNGPYYFDYDVPIDKNRHNWNLFSIKIKQPRGLGEVREQWKRGGGDLR